MAARNAHDARLRKRAWSIRYRNPDASSDLLVRAQEVVGVAGRQVDQNTAAPTNRVQQQGQTSLDGWLRLSEPVLAREVLDLQKFPFVGGDEREPK